MKILSSGLFIFIFSLALASRVDACSCVFTSTCEEFTDASAIFIGKMIGGTEDVDIPGEENKTVTYQAGQVRFSVEETFKGSVSAETTVSVKSNINTSCGPYGLIPGERYLVYAYGDAGHLHTGVCTRTQLVSRLKPDDEDLQFLRTIPKGVNQGRIAGSALVGNLHGVTPVEDVTIHLQSEKDQIIEKTPDKKGYFEFSGLEEGIYTVEVLWPENIFSDVYKRSLPVQNKSCTPVDFWGKFETGFKGRVLDSGLHPVAVSLNVAQVGARPETQKDPSIYPDLDGKFKIQGLAPGNYLLYIELRADDPKKNQKYFYPGVKEIEKAGIIKIGLGQKVDEYDFILPKEFTLQSIEGRVMQIDGTPAAGVHVRLLCPKNRKTDEPFLNLMQNPGRTDENGNFKLRAVKGVTYRLQANNDTDFSINKASEMRSPARLITPEQNLYDIELVLSESGWFDFKCDSR